MFLRTPLIAISLLLGVEASVQANAEELIPFSAEYRISVNRIPTPIRAELSLEATDQPDRYRMQFNIDSRLMKNTETTEFDWNDCQPKTHQYRHSFSGFGRQRNHQMDFFWDEPAQIVTTSYRGRQDPEFEAFEIPEGTLDDLTMLLKTRCLISEGEETYTVDAAYGSGFRTHVVRVAGSEVLDTPMGELQTLIIERVRERDEERGRDRHTRFWIAPALNNMLVRARHVEDSGLYGEINMRSYTGPINRQAEQAFATSEATEAEEAEEVSELGESTTKK